MRDDLAVLVTGASGFLGRHIVMDLLEAGYRVKAAVRSSRTMEQLTPIFGRHVAPDPLEDRLQFVQLDLLMDDNWEQACSGCTAMIHAASPVPGLSMKEDAAFLRPAVDGTRRALEFARRAEIRKVVLTSSDSTMSGAMPDAPVVHLSEADWADPDRPGMSAYVRSKILAERLAWSMAERDPELRLTTLLPGVLFGPGVGGHFSSSAHVVERIFSGRDPALPRLSFALADVRDVARAHCLALSNPDFENRRVAAIAGELWSSDIADILRTAYPGQRITKWTAPDWSIRLLSLVDRPLGFFVPSLGRQLIFDKTRFRALLGRDPIVPSESVLTTARSLVEAKRLRPRHD